MKTKLIDPIDIKQAVKNKQLKIYIGEDRSNHKKYIYCADIISVNKPLTHAYPFPLDIGSSNSMHIVNSCDAFSRTVK